MTPLDHLLHTLQRATSLGDHPHEKTWRLHDPAPLIIKLLLPPPHPAHAAQLPSPLLPSSPRRFIPLSPEARRQLGLDPELPWLLCARPFLEGEPLHALSPALLASHAPALLSDLCASIAALHAQGLVHGDIQPANVLLHPDSLELTLIDLATFPTSASQAHHVAGSAPLMAPELWSRAEPSVAADLYALATLAIYLYNKKNYPLHADDLAAWATAHQQHTPRLDHLPLDGKLRGTLERMLAKDPQARPPLSELQDLLPPPSPQTRERSPLRPPSHSQAITQILEHQERAPHTPLPHAIELLSPPHGLTLSLLRELELRLQLAHAHTVLLDGARLLSLELDAPEQAPELPSLWRAPLRLIDALRRRLDLPPLPSRDAAWLRGDQLHLFDFLSRSLLDTLRQSPHHTFLLWHEPATLGADTMAWLTHLLDTLPEDAPLTLVLTSPSEHPIFDASRRHVQQLTLAQPDLTWWRTWKHHHPHASIRDLPSVEFERLLATHHHSVGQMRLALGLRHDDASPTPQSIEACIAQGAFLTACERGHEALSPLLDHPATFSPADHLPILQHWVEATLAVGASSAPHLDSLEALLDALLTTLPPQSDTRDRVAILAARHFHGKSNHLRGLEALEPHRVPLTPLDLERAFWHAQLLLSAGRLPDALKSLELTLSRRHLLDGEEAAPLWRRIELLRLSALSLDGELAHTEALERFLLEHDDGALPDALRARAHAYLAIGHGRAGRRAECTQHHLRALDLIERAGLAAELPTYLLNVGTAYHSQGKLGLAYEYYARGARQAPASRTHTRQLLLRNQADIDIMLGRHHEALALLDRAESLARHADLPEHVIMARAYRANVLSRQGDHLQALTLLAALQDEPVLQRPPRRAQLLLHLAEAQLATGSLEIARETLHEARNLIETHNLSSLSHTLGALLGLLRIRSGGSLEELAGVETLRHHLRLALEHADHTLVLRFAPTLHQLATAQSLEELSEEAARLHREALSAVAASLAGPLRQDFLANHPPLLAAPTRHAHPSPASPRPAAPAATSHATADVEPFYRMLSLNELILSTKSPEELWRHALEIALSLSGAERSFLLVRNDLLEELGAGEGLVHHVGALGVVASQDLSHEPIPRPHLKVSATIAEEAARTGRTVSTLNAREDNRFNAALSVVGLDLTSVLCVPVRDATGLLGALYLDHRFQPGIFEGEIRRMMEAFGHQFAMAITTTLRLTRLDHSVTALDAARRELERLLEEREQSVHVLERHVEQLQHDLERSELTARSESLRQRFPHIAYASSAMERVLSQVERIARGEIPVIITGESGTGKELVARAIHVASARRSGPFLAINCGAIPEQLFESELFGHLKGSFTGAIRDRQGLFAAAQGGTVFLDELGEMPLSMQVKLLRVLQERKVRRVGSTQDEPIDVRIVAATNKDLEQMIAQGTFRQDLYYRLAAFTLELPPLDQRREDIALIAVTLLERVSQESVGHTLTLSPEALRLLTLCHWPGNVRQLENVLRAASVLATGDTIEVETLAGLVQVAPPHAEGSREEGRARAARPAHDPTSRARARPSSRRGRRKKVDEQALRQAIATHGDDVEAIAEQLGVSTRTIYRYLNTLDT